VELDERIMRLLSIRPVKRFNCSAREAAESFEKAARSAGPKADEPLFEWEMQPAAEGAPGKAEASRRVGHRPRQRELDAVRRSRERDSAAQVEHERREAAGQEQAPAPMEEEGPGTGPAKLGLAAIVLMLVFFAVRPLGRGAPPQEEMPPVAEALPDEQHEQRDGGSAGLGDGTSAAAVMEAAEKIPSYAAGFAKEVPRTPLGGQRRPPCRPRLLEVEIRGGCWYEPDARLKPPCVDGSYEWQGSCYVPVLGQHPVPTSDDP
jgi:hypothetical protein